MSTPSTSTTLREYVRDEAAKLGFDRVSFTLANLPRPVRGNLQSFVESGHHGTMEWLEETVERRSDPQTLWPEARSVIVLAMNYGPETDPLDALLEREKATLSVYARNRDYHDIIKGRLKTLAAKLVSRAKAQHLEGDVKVFVDTAPVMEKPLAQQAGLGWQGKHTNLVSREMGSWFFLGSIFTTLEMIPDEPEIDHCGSCRNCLDICPTKAFPAPYKIDARRCISYLTIENKGLIPLEFRKAMGNRIYGCDDCLAVCPWNKFAAIASEAKLAAPQNSRDTRLAHLLTLDDAAFRKLFSGSPVKRIGRDRFLRNCLVAAGNSSLPNLIPNVEPHLADPNPIVRATAVWAMGELVVDAVQQYSHFKDNEQEAVVLNEWRLLENKSEQKSQ